MGLLFLYSIIKGVVAKKMEPKIKSLEISIIPSNKFETVNLCLFLCQKNSDTHSLINIIRQFTDGKAKEQQFIMDLIFTDLNIVRFNTYTFESRDGIITKFFIKAVLLGDLDSKSKMVGILKLLGRKLYDLLSNVGIAEDNNVDIYIMGNEKHVFISEDIKKIFSKDKSFKFINTELFVSKEKKNGYAYEFKVSFSNCINIYDASSLALLMISFSYLFNGPNSLVNSLLRETYRLIYNYNTDLSLVDSSIYLSFQTASRQEGMIQELTNTIENGWETISGDNLQIIKRMLRTMFNNISDNPEAIIDFSYKFKCDVSSIHHLNELVLSVTLKQIKSFLGSISILPINNGGVETDV